MQLKLLLPTKAILALAAVVFLLGCEIETEPGIISVLKGSQATATLRAIGLPDAATDVSDIDESGPDGPMPEIALQSFAIESTPAELRAEFTRRCSDTGLGEPDAELLRSEPETLCSGQLEGGRTHLLMSATCPDGTCQVTLQVQRLPF